MTFDANRPDLTLGIVGTGIMGRGIAQIAALAGCQVLLLDSRAGAAAEARSYVEGMLGRLAEKGKLDEPGRLAAVARLGVAEDIAALAPCHVVVEAIVENLEAKQELMRQLEAVVGDDCLLATNTSSLSVTSIARAARLPARVAGFHFFNPVPLMKVVEVIAGVMSAPWTCEALTALARRMGHRPVLAKDTPGFIVNHAGRGFGTEALRVLGEGVAEVAAIDRVLKGAAGFRMGPFELLDLTGLDVSHPVMESVYSQFYHEPRFRPSPITAQRLDAGLLGRKTGRGFYDYAKDATPVTLPPVPAVARPSVVWLEDSPAAAPVAALLAQLGCAVTHESPAGSHLCVVAPIGEDATSAALRLGLDARRTVAVDALFLAGHRTVMTTPVTLPEIRDAAHALFAADGTAVSVIHDSPGLIAQRVVATIINIACDIAQQRIATPDDIDGAVTLGLGYPKGPLAWGDALGPTTVLTILERMQALTGDPRYRPSLWLRRRALLGVSLHTNEN
jgi:3-hydroxybutyryl-CoA dehydrogenase